MKVCSKCGIEKDEGEFCKDKTKKEGLSTHCKKCRKEYHKEYRKEYYKKNKEHIFQRDKIYREKNKKRIKLRNKNWYEKNKEHCKEYDREYKEKNKEHCREYNREYKENNIKIINGEEYNINTVPDELKPVIKQLIDIKNAKKELREKRKKIEKGEI